MALKNLLGGVLKSALSSSTSKSSGTSGFDLSDLASMAQGIIGDKNSTKKTELASSTTTDLIKSLASKLRDNDDDDDKNGGLLENATGVFKALMVTNTENADNADKDEINDELDILKKIIPTKLSKGNLTIIVQKVISSFAKKDQTESNVLDKLSSFKNIDMSAVSSIVTKLLK